MSALVLVGLLLVGAKPSKPVPLPMPPPPAVKPKPPPEPEAVPAAAPAPAPAPASAAAEVTAEAPKRSAAQRSLLSKIRFSGGVGPGFSLGGNTSGVTPPGGNPIWLRGTVRATLDLLHAGPGDLQILVPIALQGTGFRWNILGVIIAGSVFGGDVMPSARYQAEVIPDVSLFGELGLGFGFFQVTVQQQFVGYQSAGASGFGVRLGGGIEYRLMDQLRLLIQPIDLTALTVSSTTTQNGQTITTTGTASQFSMIIGAVVSL